MRTRGPSYPPPQRRFRPAPEGMEARDLPSGFGPLSGPVATGQPPLATPTHASPHPVHAGRHTPAGRGHTHAQVGGAQAGGPLSIDPALLPGIINRLYGSNPPTPAEVRREAFVVKFVADYTVGPPRFSDRATTIHGVTNGDVVVSNQFQKGRAQFVLFPPADPNARPDYGNPYANQVTGQTAIFEQNFLQTGNLLILDLNGPAGTEANGLPTRLNWSFDGASGGAYTGVTGFLQGAGVVDLKYLPDANPLPGSAGSGRVLFTFQGLLNQSQIVNPIAKIYS